MYSCYPLVSRPAPSSETVGPSVRSRVLTLEDRVTTSYAGENPMSSILLLPVSLIYEITTSTYPPRHTLAAN
jgi:hypothetical protein